MLVGKRALRYLTQKASYVTQLEHRELCVTGIADRT